MIDFRIDKTSAVPIYRQVMDLILAGLSSRRIGPNEQLPTIRELAVRLEVNPNTIVKAYSQLQMMGVLDTQQGSGVFATGRAEQAVPADHRRRQVEQLCGEFVGRAQLLDISLKELIEYLKTMR